MDICNVPVIRTTVRGPAASAFSSRVFTFTGGGTTVAAAAAVAVAVVTRLV